MATRKNNSGSKRVVVTSAPVATTADSVKSVGHRAKRKNIPPAGLEAQGRVEEAPKLRHHYNPHLPPVLRFAAAGGEPAAEDRLPALLQTARERALSADEAAVLAEALRRHEPWLEWSGKRERPWFEVEPPALHIHERVSTQAMLRVLAREDVNRDLFADPQQSYAEAVQFYRHDVDWANRMILGDSLAVMASLGRREDLAGKVQMIYIDPPYGISFKSNFQPQLGQRDVKDREQDLTREPEMVKAYRDTWTLGIHSYLAYLRDRLAMAKELLTDSGSVFVQISDENLHRVRMLMDEVFGAENFVRIIQFKKTTTASGDTLASVCDYLIWYSRQRDKLKYRELFSEKRIGAEGASQYSWIETSDGARVNFGMLESDKHPEPDVRVFVHDNITSQRPAQGTDVTAYSFQGSALSPGKGTFKSDQKGLSRLDKAGRLMALGNTLRYVRFLNDFPVFQINNFWEDTVISGFSDPKIYVVQTSPQVLARCLLMTTDPGDLVLDPTCGSGTTAYVAEQWGRRWITCDTSRVALALAKQRLMTATFKYHRLRPLSAEDLSRNPGGAWLRNGSADPMTFACRTVPHITLKSIARNTSLDPIFEYHDPHLASRLISLNTTLAENNGARVRAQLVAKLEAKVRAEGIRAVSDADLRRWLLPGTKEAEITERKAAKLRARIPPEASWRAWEVPFDSDPDWPPNLAEALSNYRGAWRVKMDAVNACISANAEMEELVDQPVIEPGVVRVSGPFTMEGVIARELGDEGEASPIDGAPAALETFGDGGIDAANAEAHLDKVLRLLKASGVDFAGNQNRRFARLEPIASRGLLHAEGDWIEHSDRRVAVSIGPEVGNVTAFQVEDAVRTANRAGFDEVVFAGFGFDAAAQAAIDEASHPKLFLHMALIRPDVAMGNLLKAQPGSQLFTVFSAPRVKPPKELDDGQHTIEVEGMDVYDPVSNALFPTSRDRIAAWFIDSDYDGRSFCICQAFFPDRKKWDKLARALGERGIVDESRFDALSGFESLPFARPPRLPAGATWRVAVKVIDPRGNEGLRVVTMAADGH